MPLIDGPSQATRGHHPERTQTTTQPQSVTEPYPAVPEARRIEEPPEQPTTQAEAPATSTSAPNTQHPQHQEIEAQENQ
jgi:hypothetical protein